MVDLTDYQWEMGGVVFGNDNSTPTFAEEIEIGPAEWVTQDADNPLGDGRVFGRDTLRAPTLTFSLVIDCGTELDARRELERLTRAWRARGTARTPGATVPLRYRLGGETRRIYGRPRNFAPDDWSGLSQGVVTASAQFVADDSKSYSDVRSEMTVGLVPMVAGGLTGPLSGNLTSMASGERAGLVTVGGGVETYAEVTFKGPVSNPRVRSTGWEIGLNGQIAYDQTITVSSRDNSIKRSDGANVAGMLSRQSYLSDVRLQPGPQEIIFEGTDLTGSATATVRWETALESTLGSN